MKTVNIFVASSFELRRWREAIGDYIRSLSDKYESNGFRIKLSCREDYHPEFTGTRKQTEYNEDLVKPCNLFFALFWERCGEYTQEEIKVGNLVNPSNLYVIRKKINKKTDDLDVYLNHLKNPIFEVSHIKEVLNLIKTKLEEYIETKYSPFIPAPEHWKTYNVFATIPDDKGVYRLIFSNLIRSLDNFAEEKLKIRCKLKWNTFGNLRSSNYYLGLLRDQLSDKDQLEITYAVEHSRPNSNPEVSILYYKHTDSVIRNYPEIGKLIEKYGCFKEELDSLHRVKYNLLVWLISKKVLAIDDISGVSINDNGWVEFMKMPLIPCSSLNIPGTSNRELLYNLLAKIRSEIFNPQHELIDFDPKKPIDIDSLRDHIDKVNVAGALAQKLNDDVITAKRQSLDKINERLRFISSMSSREYIKEAIELIGIKKGLLKDLFDMNLETLENLLRSNIQFVSICDRNRDIAVSIGIDVDHSFKQIVEIADSNHFYDAQVEMMRMNYANYLSRENQNREAVECYNKTMHNMALIDDLSPITINYLTAVFLNFAHSLADLGAIDMLTKLISDFEYRVVRWSEAETLPYPKIIYRIFVLSILLTERNTGKFAKYIDEGITIYKTIYELDINQSDRIWDDVFCTFPTTLVASILDYMPNQKGLDLVIPIVEKTLNIIDKNPNLDLDEKYCHISNLYHNLAYGYSNVNDQISARKFGLKALEIRRVWFKKSNKPYILRQIASNLLMIGATYINGRTKYLSSDTAKEALNYAEESLDICQKLNNNDFIEEETDVYKAKLLIGSILIDSRKNESEGKALVKECLEWSRKNPANSYRDTFEREAFRYLKQ